MLHLEMFQNFGLKKEIFSFGQSLYAMTPPVLNKISFNVKATEKIGVIGRTGAGKSSLISVLFRLYPFDGQVVIDGVDTKEISLTSL
jgi:ABC-type multidrug transport system fused ATPase/permease subunit